MSLKMSAGLVIIAGIIMFPVVCFGDCPSGDFTDDCFVDFDDVAAIGSQWLEGYDWNDVNTVSAQWLTGVPDVVLIPAGEFMMGDHFEDWKPTGIENEFPVHAVYIDSFYMSRYETTNRQYCEFLNSADVNVLFGTVYATSDDTHSYPYCRVHSFSGRTQIEYSDTTGVFTILPKAGKDVSDYPVVQVGWYGAAAYCNWRSQQEGYEGCYDITYPDPNWACDFNEPGYRLPTEAEWEYAGRGGEHDPHRRFPWGENEYLPDYPNYISHDLANYYPKAEKDYYYDYTAHVEGYEGCHPDYIDGVHPYTAPVHSFQPNGYGLYHMAGNIFEWCNDFYNETYYEVSPYDNPTGPGPGVSSYRITRGGSWQMFSMFARVAYRGISYPDGMDYTQGFRFILDLEVE